MRWTDEMPHGFGYGIEHQADSHTCAKKHCKPGHGTEFWFGILSAKSDFSILTESKVQGKPNKNVYSRYKQPVGWVGNEDPRRVKCLFCGFPGNQCSDDQGCDQNYRGPKNGTVNIEILVWAGFFWWLILLLFRFAHGSKSDSLKKFWIECFTKSKNRCWCWTGHWILFPPYRDLQIRGLHPFQSCRSARDDLHPVQYQSKCKRVRPLQERR